MHTVRLFSLNVNMIICIHYMIYKSETNHTARVSLSDWTIHSYKDISKDHVSFYCVFKL